MLGVYILGYNDIIFNVVLIIVNLSNIIYNDYKGEDYVYKVLFWVFMCLCVLVCVFVIMLWVINKW